MEKGCLNVGLLLFRVLDEADEMLRMGFVDDVELILGNAAHFFWHCCFLCGDKSGVILFCS